MTRPTDGPGEAAPLTPLSEWLPPAVRAAVAPIDPRIDDLHAEEAALIERAVPVRQREFAAGRRLARRLLAELGCSPTPLLRLSDRSPRWPDQVVGTIAHSRELCAVAVASRGHGIVGVGLDLEPDAAMAPELANRILTAREQAAAAALTPAERGRYATLAFAVKEAVFKCVHPVGNDGLEFSAVEVEPDLVSLASDHSMLRTRPAVDLLRRIGSATLECGAERRAGHWLVAALLSTVPARR